MASMLTYDLLLWLCAHISAYLNVLAKSSRPFFSVTSVTSCSNPDHRWTIDEIRRAEREAKDV
jgi:hypothetical protein